ncbi:hypothetical protein ANCDUO_22956 [Ancylostoma duodenale]|uniref:Uncharacterized protein n=1 Tax=Ancylostoma duodenale TaxID=51022 RepID=A0A0C2BSY9_9BILA|nr:hypothetical protein ANCDUO_22956 [Ancylostoma duodenale]
MDKLQGGDWNSFFHQFEAVASQSTTNVSRPSIVDDNVPLPIIRGHHFDIAYQETVDEHVKCQVCGMLLRRTMFAAHVRQRHPELIPPSLSTDDDSGRHSGLESPDISRNPNFPFSPKLMSPPITKEPIKLTISLKGHRKHRRRKTKRDRRGEEAPTTTIEEEHHSPVTNDSNIEDRFFWPDADQPGPSTQRSTPSFLGHGLSPSGRLKATETRETVEDVITRISPVVQARAELEDSSDEDSRKRKKRKSRRKTRRKEHDVVVPSPPLRSRVLPAVEPLRLAITPEGARVIEPSRDRHSPQGTCRIASQTERTRPETRSYTHSQQASTRSAFTDLIQSFPATSHVLPVAQPFPHFTSQVTTSSGVAYDANQEEAQTVTVGQPAQRAERTDVIDTLLPQIPPVATVLTPSSWVYSQSQITTDAPILPTYNTRSVRKAAVESASFRAEAIPFDPVIKPTTILEPEAVKAVTGNAFLGEELADPVSTENRRPVLPQRKTRQPSGSQEAWEPLGIKSPTYGIVLPVAPRQDNDADDATVAFLTSSPELLSEDDSCPVKEEVEDVQSTLGASPSRILRQKFRTATSATSESTDTDQRTIIDVEEDQAERRSSDRDGEVQSLAMKLAALSQDSERRKPSVDEETPLLTKTPSEVVEESARETAETLLETSDTLIQPIATPPDKQFETSQESPSREELVFTPETQHIPVLDGTLDDLIASGQLAEYKRPEIAEEVLAHSAVDETRLNRDFEEALEEQEEFVPSQPLEEGVSALSIESEHGEMPIHVLLSARVDDSVQEDVPTGTSDNEKEITLSPAPAIDPRDKMMRYREEEELSSYEEDYSAEDDELVDLHESSVSNYHELEQQSQYEEILRQQPPSSVTPTEDILYPDTPVQSQIMQQPVILEQAPQIPQWPSQASWRSQSGPRELRVQTAFEGSSQVVVHHSEPIPQRLSSHRPSMPSSFHYGPATVLTPHQQPPPHSFPLQSGQSQRIETSQWHAPQQYSAQMPLPERSLKEVQEAQYSTASNQQVLYEQQQQQQVQLQYQHTQFQPYKPRPPVVSAPSEQYFQPQVPPVSFQQRYLQHQQHPLDGQQQQTFAQQQQGGIILQEKPPAELMEEEMRAMRYVYLMNEQRIAKKALAEMDKKAPKKPDLPSNLMFLPELPPLIIEPTVIPEGVPRHRMQEHILPPYHHAQFAVRRGPCVSPHKSTDEDESSEDDTRELRELMNLAVLEPPTVKPKIPASVQQSPQKAQYFTPEVPMEEHRRQHYPSGGSYRSGQFPVAEQRPEVPTQLPPMVSDPSATQPLQSLEISIPNDVTILSRELSSVSEEESELSAEETLPIKEASQRESSDESTDSDAVRRQWDLSPSVSPLTLEALTSGMSSPEGSDSNDGQAGVPVWPTISRKHAKLAIAACRNMPKRFQPLCRRFAWQQGITYLLENFCLKKWEIRPEHDSESVWFFERDVRRFKPFELEPFDVPGVEPNDENDFYGFNICADIPMKRCCRTIRLEDHAAVSLSCQEVPGDVELSSTDDEGYSDEETEYASSVYYDIDDVAPSSLKLIPSSGVDGESRKVVLQDSEEESEEESDESSEESPVQTAGRSAVQVTSLLSELYREHRAAYELMIADTLEIPTPDQREIPFSDDADWVASRILAINRAQNRLLIPCK